MILRDFFDAALSEDEGYGSAYEYYLKYLLIKKELKGKKIRSLIILGLPERYGFSMDFMIFAKRFGIKNISVVEEVKEKLNQFEKISKGLDLPNAKILHGGFESSYKADLILSSEVLQRIKDKENFLDKVRESSKYAFIFAPNRCNKSHKNISRLKGLSKGDFSKNFKTGFIDMPPFSPGVSIGDKQRKTTRLYPLLLPFIYLEKFYPEYFKKRFSHIVYGIYKR